MDNRVNDKNIISYQKYCNGDDEGIVEIVKEFRKPLLSYVDSFLDDLYASEDIVEDVFLKLMIKKPKIDKETSFKNWIYAIAKNKTIDYIRKNKRMVISDLTSEEMVLVLEKSGDISHQNYDFGGIQEIVDKLNVRYQLVLKLKYIDEFDNKEIAKIMGKSPHGIETLLYRAKKEVKKYLEGYKNYEK